MKIYEDSKKILEKEIENINSKGELSPNTLEVMYKVVDILKDIETICAMKEENEYSERMMYGEDASYARGRRGRRYSRDYSGVYDERVYDSPYSRGSYNSYGEDSYDGSYARRYSREDEHEQFEKMLREAKTEQERNLIRQLMEVKKSM